MPFDPEEILSRFKTVEEIDAQLAELDRLDYEDGLYKFFRAGWHTMDPAPWKDGWAIDAISEHLQAVADGEIKRLIVNVPPRMSKSGLASVAFPAWVWAQPERRWGPCCGPHVQFMYASYAQKLSVEHSVKCRRIIQSPWYQRLWGDRYKITTDQNVKTKYENDRGGVRQITSVDSGTTGTGGQIIVLDDPNDASDVASEAAIQTAIDFWEGTLSTRLNDPQTGAFVIVQQRIAENDITGHVLSHDLDDWTHLMLPMFYEPERSFITSIGWQDPRKYPGELLWPERFSEESARALEKKLGPFRASGQLQQSPEPQGGGIIKREWWQLWESDTFPPMDYILASLDTAYTTKEENDPCALTVWGIFHGDSKAQATRRIGPDGRPLDMGRAYIEGAPKVALMYAWSERLELHDLVKRVADTCKRFRVDKLLIENKASGHSVSQELRRLYGAEDFAIQLVDPRGQDKMARLYSVQHLFAEGLIYAPDKKWSEEVISQVARFPAAEHDDLTDTCSQGLRHLREMGLLTRAQERLEELESMRQFHGRPPEPLYPA